MVRSREELLKEIETWSGVNHYIAHNARKELDSLEQGILPAEDEHRFTYEDLKVRAKGMRASQFTKWVEEEFGIRESTEKGALKRLKELLK